MEQLLCIGVCVRELRVQVGNRLSVDVGEKRGDAVIISPISGRRNKSPRVCPAHGCIYQGLIKPVPPPSGIDGPLSGCYANKSEQILLGRFL